jgi:hypothetical protein
MLTDSPPRKVNHREGFHESDRRKTLDLPQDGSRLAISPSIEAAMKAGRIAQYHPAVLLEGRRGGLPQSMRNDLRFAHKGLPDNS